jgi:hypothetical protein
MDITLRPWASIGSSDLPSRLDEHHVLHAGDHQLLVAARRRAHLGAPLDLEVADAGAPERVLRVRLDLPLQRARGRGELDLQLHAVPVGPDVLDHARLHQGHVQLRIHHARQRGEDVLLRHAHFDFRS